jgi:hypothetical protein
MLGLEWAKIGKKKKLRLGPGRFNSQLLLLLRSINKVGSDYATTLQAVKLYPVALKNSWTKEQLLVKKIF